MHRKRLHEVMPVSERAFGTDRQRIKQ